MDPTIEELWRRHAEWHRRRIDLPYAEKLRMVEAARESYARYVAAVRGKPQPEGVRESAAERPAAPAGPANGGTPSG